MMKLRLALTFLCLLLTALGAAAQTADLPSELFVLTNEGIIERYGVNAVGATPVTPEDIYVIDFGLDALGERLAYRTESGITLLGLTGGSGVPLEGATASVPPYRGVGDTIAWSPGGDALAYTVLDGARVYLETVNGPVFRDLTEGVFSNLSWSPGGTFLAAAAEDNIWWIYRREGDEMVLASVIPSSIGTAWVSNSEIVFAPADGGLMLMNLEAANAQTTLLDNSVEYRLPFLTADDQLVFFARPKNSTSIPSGYGILMRLARGAAQVETIGQQAVPLSGLRWAPGGSKMTAFQGGVLALFNPITGEGVPLPINNAVAFDWSPLRAAPIPFTPAPPTETPVVLGAPVNPTVEPEATGEVTPEIVPISTATGLVLSVDSYFLARDQGGIAQVWRLPADGNPAFRFTGSTTDISEFAISPDGRNIAYVTDGEMWLQRIDVPPPSLLATLNTFAPITPAFSPDGAQIAYAEERTDANNGGIWIYTFNGEEPELILSNDERVFRRPQWSPDGTRLLLDAYTDSAVVAAILTLETGNIVESVPAAPDDVRPLTSRWLRDGRILTYVDAGFNSSVDVGLYIFDSVSPATTPVEWLPLPENILVRDVIEVERDLYRTLLTTGGSAPIQVVDMSGVQQDTVTTIQTTNAPRLSPDGRFIASYETLTEIDGIAQGRLLFVDLLRGGQFLLSEPDSTWGFQWTR
jgi:Tol biopolymer transport system component